MKIEECEKQFGSDYEAAYQAAEKRNVCQW